MNGLPYVVITTSPKGVQYLTLDLTNLIELERSDKYIKFTIIPAKTPQTPPLPYPTATPAQLSQNSHEPIGGGDRGSGVL